MNDTLITYTEASELLSVSRSTIYRMVEDGTLNPVQVKVSARRQTSPRLNLSEVQAHKVAS